MRNTPSSTRWCRMPPTARCCAAGASRLHARIAATLEDQFPEIVVTQPRCLPGTVRRPGCGEGGRLLAQGRSAGDGALGDDGSGRPVAEGVGRAGGPAGRTSAPATGARPATRARIGTDGSKRLFGARGGRDLARARALAEQIDRPEYLVRAVLWPMGVSFGPMPSTSWRCRLPSRWKNRRDEEEISATLLLGHYIHGASCHSRRVRDRARASRAVSMA